jgi:hypothetical protein
LFSTTGLLNTAEIAVEAPEPQGVSLLSPYLKMQFFIETELEVVEYTVFMLIPHWVNLSIIQCSSTELVAPEEKRMPSQQLSLVMPVNVILSVPVPIAVKVP